jgi:hypothetical protein
MSITELINLVCRKSDVSATKEQEEQKYKIQKRGGERRITYGWYPIQHGMYGADEVPCTLHVPHAQTEPREPRKKGTEQGTRYFPC